MRPKRLPDGLVADLLGRLSIALAAGVDIRRAIVSEVARVPGRWRSVVAEVAEGVAAGEPLGVALDRSGGISSAVAGMVQVGDRTGRDAETLAAVAEAIREGVAARRAFWRTLAAPALRLVAALAVIGLLIAVSGFVRDLDGQPIDILGLGLTGSRGLGIYASCLALIVVAGAATVPVGLRSWSDRGALRRGIERLPVVGLAARAAEAARWCRAASLAAAAGVDVGSLVELASRAAPGLRRDADRVTSQLRSGMSLEESLADGGGFPREVLDAIGLGELTGTLAESLARLVPHLEDRARRGFAVAAGGLGFAAWAAVVGLVLLLVVRVMGVYVGMIEAAGRPL
jgi:type IV pilus assembly protein PilC